MPEDKKITIKDIAREAGVSPSLVSFVFNNALSDSNERRYKVSKDTAERVLKIAEKYNFKPNNAARSLRSKKTRSVGVVLSDISNSFFSLIARYIEDRAYVKNYSVLFGSSDEKVKKLQSITDTFISKGVDGLIVVPCAGSDATIKRIMERNVPLVLLDRNIKKYPVNHIMLNNELAARMAIHNLYEGGYRRIEMVSYEFTLSNIIGREQGYRQAMEEYGLEKYISIHRIDYFDIHASTDHVIQNMKITPDTALFFATNSLAIDGIKALIRRGLSSPADVGIVAFDESDAFHLYPKTITHIKQPVLQFANEAINLIINNIENDKMLPTTLILSPELVKGETSVCPLHV